MKSMKLKAGETYLPLFPDKAPAGAMAVIIAIKGDKVTFAPVLEGVTPEEIKAVQWVEMSVTDFSRAFDVDHRNAQ